MRIKVAIVRTTLPSRMVVDLPHGMDSEIVRFGIISMAPLDLAESVTLPLPIRKPFEEFIKLDSVSLTSFGQTRQR